MLPEVIRERTEEILTSCTKSVIAVKLSLDGVGAAHDTLRNTPGSFDRTMRSYRLLEELLPAHPHFELGVNTVFCSGNQDAMDGIIDHVRTMRSVRTHTISLARGALAQEHHRLVDLSRYERAIGRLEQDLRRGAAATYRFSGARIKAAQGMLQRRLILRTAREGRSLIPCYAGRLNLVLTEDGEVFPCESLSGGFGNGGRCSLERVEADLSARQRQQHEADATRPRGQVGRVLQHLALGDLERTDRLRHLGGK